MNNYQDPHSFQQQAFQRQLEEDERILKGQAIHYESPGAPDSDYATGGTQQLRKQTAYEDEEEEAHTAKTGSASAGGNR